MNSDPNELAAAAVTLGELPLELELKRIEGFSRVEMCRLWRYAPPGHPYFRKGTPESEAFDARFKMLGGWSPEISKLLG